MSSNTTIYAIETVGDLLAELVNLAANPGLQAVLNSPVTCRQGSKGELVFTSVRVMETPRGDGSLALTLELADDR